MDKSGSHRFNMYLNNELARLTALRNLNLLDTSRTEAFDRITRLAAKLFDLPISAVSLTDSDRQWFKSRVGVEHRQIPRLQAPCAEVADASESLVITDLLESDNYRDSYLATSGVRFYAGAPLITKEGFCLGAMCVLGMQPRLITAGEMVALQDMASMVMEQIELRRSLGRVESISGLPNRLQFKEDYEDLVEERRGEHAHLVMVTIARPEEVSAAVRVMGSLYIEEMAREAILLLTTAVEEIGTIFHVGETQFVFFAARGIELKAYSQKLSNILRTHRTLEVSRFVTTKAVGIVPFNIGALGHNDLLRMAHSATQDAHDSHTHVSSFSVTQDSSFHRRFLVMNRFGAALENLQTLHLVYQPRVDTGTERCVGVEALLRWTDPLLGVVSPGEFMPIIELSSMARAVTEWVLNQAITQLGCWQKEGLDLQMSVNISASNLAEPDFVPRLLALVSRHGVSPEGLELEITESAFMANTNEALTMLEEIADSGIRLAIDDFGTGYSSLSYLEKLPANVIKIDQSFIKDMLANPRKRSLVTTMIKLTHDLGYRVVAEGVETREVADFLQQANCDEAQGYFFARPMPIDQLQNWLREGGCNHDFNQKQGQSSKVFAVL